MPGSPAAIFQLREEVVWSVKGNTLRITEQKGRKNPAVDAAAGTLNNQTWDVPALEHLWRNKYSLWFNPNELDSTLAVKGLADTSACSGCWGWGEARGKT